MKIKQLAMLMMLTALSFVLNGCGGGGGGGGGGETPVTITVTASKSTAFAENIDNVNIEVTISPSASMGTVSFAVTSGSATLSASSASISGGKAAVTVKSASPGNVTVTATYQGSSASTGITFTAPPLFTLTPSKVNIFADNADSSTITATFAAPLPDGYTMAFAVTQGTGTLDAQSVPVVTDQGISRASVKLTSSTIGKITVTATFGSRTITTDVNAVQEITVNSSKATLFADGTDSATITAVLKSSVPEGTAVQFTVTSGTATLSAITATSGNKATAKVTSTTVGKVTVTASFSGFSGSTTVDFVAVPAITVTPSKGTVRADGQDSSTITATFASAVPDGTPVTFAISAGPGTLSSATANTVANAASVTLKSGSFGQTTVNASYAGSSGATTVNFPQPLSANVAVALKMSVKQVTFLSFKLINNPASSVAIAQSNVTLASDIAGSTQLALFDYTDPTATLTLNRPTSTSTGFDVVANRPFIQLLYTVQPGFMPLFSVSLNGITEPAGTFNSANPGSSIPLPLTTSDFVVTVVYRDVHGNSF